MANESNGYGNTGYQQIWQGYEKDSSSTDDVEELLKMRLAQGGITGDIIANKTLNSTHIESISADIITTGTLRAITVEGVNILGAEIISSNDEGDRVEISNGNIRTYKENELMMKIVNYDMYWYSSRNNKIAGELAPSWRESEDKVGFSFIAHQDYLAFSHKIEGEDSSISKMRFDFAEEEIKMFDNIRMMNNKGIITEWYELNKWTAWSGKAEYAKDALGFVNLRGRITGGQDSYTLLTMTGSLAPKTTQRFSCASGNNSAIVEVNSNGDITVLSGYDSNLYLDSIRYFAGL